MTWNSAPDESIETIRQDFLSLLEKIQKEARKQSGITVEDGSETLTVEQFTEMMERNLESIKKSNHVTREGYDAMATRVKRINVALGLVEGLAGSATGAVVGGGAAGGSNGSLRTFLGNIQEKHPSILDALDALWRNSEQKIADSNAQPASWMSKRIQVDAWNSKMHLWGFFTS
uniref:Uncharacterized protein n=1 Tax=Timspurckia oligopyrenoides TaxID=708627 RepID=A0A7S0ZLD9_9RHOD|mmetsp:Transcript_9819/g.17707  ORF Transcript_9819/g.17707 Transcript_9819/m.17707 type:complete len:174 (+) Transcript_9819:165-686(+)